MLEIAQLSNQPVLTDREQQVLELVAIGLSAKEVAQKISIAPRTVERHIENIRLKMRARNRTHMVTCAAMAGLLAVSPTSSAADEALSAAPRDVDTPIAPSYLGLSDDNPSMRLTIRAIAA